MDWKYGIVCLLAILSVFVSILRCEMAERKAEALEEKLLEAEKDGDMIRDAFAKLEGKCAKLEEKVDGLPTEQIREIYDSEKQFQDGLNSIMNFGLQNFGLNKDGMKHE